MSDVVDPSRKRKIRLGVALSVAVLLGVALVYVSFNASDQTREPSQILSATPGEKFEMNAKVVPKSVRHDGETLKFEVEDRNGGATMPVSYQGVVPDPFRGGREIVLKEGRFGPYVTDGETNASLRKGDDPETVTLDRAVELLAERRAKGPAKRSGGRRKRS